MWTIFLKSLLNLLQHCFCFMFWFFGLKAWGILAPWPRIKPTPCSGRQSLNQWPPGKSLNFSFFEESPYCFPYFMHQFTFPPTIHKDSFFTSSTLTSCCFDDSHSSMCEVVSYSGLGLHFSDDYWCWTPFQVVQLLSHVWIFETPQTAAL